MTMAPIIEAPARLTILLFVSLIVSGCSGSSDSGSIELGNTSTAADTIAQNESSDTSTPTTTEITPSENSDSNLNPDSNQIENDTSVEVLDSSIVSSTRVTFDITVPVYVSDALQVRLVWGELDTVAAWVVDESWTISEELPTNSLNPLVVTFSDANGAITLGSVETEFRTGSNASETLQISSTQFDTDRWDADNDGVSNLSESILGTNPLGDEVPAPLRANLELVPDKTFRFEWDASASATFYRVLENSDRVSGFSNISGDLDANTLRYDHRVALLKRMNASYIIQACNAQGCTDSEEISVPDSLAQAVGYFKANDAEARDYFGSQVALSSDGNTMAVTRTGEWAIESATRLEGIYIYARIDGAWQQQAILESSGTLSFGRYGQSLSLSSNGDSLAVGSEEEFSRDAEGNLLRNEGAVYLYRRESGRWREEVRLESERDRGSSFFGSSVSLSLDGGTLAVGARGEGLVIIYELVAGEWLEVSRINANTPRSGFQFGRAVSLNGNGNTLAVGADDHMFEGGAAYVFVRNDSGWQQQAILIPDDLVDDAFFGRNISLDADGDVLTVGAPGWRFFEDDDRAAQGAAYVFRNVGGTWQQEARLNTSFSGDHTGGAVDLSGDGSTLVVLSSKFVTVYKNDGVNWPIYLRFNSSMALVSDGSTTELDENDRPSAQGFSQFSSISLSSDSETLVIGASNEDSAAREINGDRFDESRTDSGAVFLF